MAVLVDGLAQIVCVSRDGHGWKTGQDMDKIDILESSDGIGLSIVINEDGRIADIGTHHEVLSRFKNNKFREVINARGKSVIPGLVDAHTHPVWAGDRVHEFAMKLAGLSYLEIHQSGGGINFTVDKTREATKEKLLTDLVTRLNKMTQQGTTLVECKSGYGLDWETELKMLQVIEDARSKVNLEISSTYCGAHAVPKGKSSTEAATEIIDKHLPAIRALNDSGKLRVNNVDVFCEKGVFERKESLDILTRARDLGFRLNFHAEELNYLGGAEMGASLGAEAISHLEEISDEGIRAMAKAGSVAVLLPTTAFILRLRQPPARKLIEAGVVVALGSDFNPNAHCLSMPIVMLLACVQMHLTPNEALVAATLNAARSMRRETEVGSLEVGKWANMLIIDAPRWEHLIYQIGGAKDIISEVIYRGQVINNKES